MPKTGLYTPPPPNPFVSIPTRLKAPEVVGPFEQLESWPTPLKRRKRIGRLMDASLERICALLSADNPEIRTAAARVLGALAPKDRRWSSGPSARPFRVPDRDPAGVPRLTRSAVSGVPMLYDRRDRRFLSVEGDLGRRAMEVVSEMGRPVLGALKKRLVRGGRGGTASHPFPSPRACAGAPAWTLILHALEKGFAEHVVSAGRRLAEELSGASIREKKALIARLEKFLAFREGETRSRCREARPSICSAAPRKGQLRQLPPEAGSRGARGCRPRPRRAGGCPHRAERSARRGCN